jgi:hypothetical protein
MVAGNRVEFKTKVAGISHASQRPTLGIQPAGAAEAMHKRGCEGGLEMAALVQPVEAQTKRTITWTWTTPRLKKL